MVRLLAMAVLSRREPATEARRREAMGEFMLATVALLGEGHSYADLTVERIAAVAGRTRTAFYFYFRDKRQLLMRATEQVAERLFAEADGWWSGERGAADLEPAISNVLRIYRDQGPLLSAVVEASTYDEEVGRFWRGVVGRFIEATERRLLAEGDNTPDSAQALAFVLVWGTERCCYQHVARGNRLDDQQLVDALLEVWQRTVYPDA